MSKNLKYLIFTQPLQERGWGEAKKIVMERYSLQHFFQLCQACLYFLLGNLMIL